MDEWVEAASRELGVAGLFDPAVTVETVLDVAREVAHAVERPAAPVTAFLLGLAAARSGGSVDEGLAEAAAAVTALARAR